MAEMGTKMIHSVVERDMTQVITVHSPDRPNVVGCNTKMVDLWLVMASGTLCYQEYSLKWKLSIISVSISVGVTRTYLAGSL